MEATPLNQWGGQRKGAGRPKGKGRFRGQPTKSYRLPIDLENEILAVVAEKYPHLEYCLEESSQKIEKNV